MTNPTQEAASAASSASVSNPAAPRRSHRRALVAVCAIGALSASVISLIPQTPAYQERHFSRQPLTALQREHARYRENPIFLYYLGLRLNQRGQFAQADPVLRQAVALDLDAPRLRDEWARSLINCGLTSTAHGELIQFTHTHPASGPGHLFLGKYYVTQKAFQQARDELERAVALSPDSAESWGFLAEAARGRGDKARARQAAERAVRLQPANGQYHLLLASILAGGATFELARREFVSAVALTPRDARAHQAYADWLLKHPSLEDRRAGLAEAQAAIAQDGADPLTLLTLGRALQANGRPADAAAPLTRAASLAPADPVAASLLAHLNLQLGRNAEAKHWQTVAAQRQKYAAQLQVLTDQVRVAPNSRPLNARLAHLLGLQGQTVDCLRYRAAALHCAQDAQPALTAAAEDLTAGGHADLALPLARHAVLVADHSGLSHQTLGDVLLALGQYDEAVREYQKAVDWEPNRDPALRRRLQAYVNARALRSRAAYRQAVALMRTTIGPSPVTPQVLQLANEATSLAPDNPAPWRLLLDAQIALKQWGEAIPTARKLLALRPRDASAHALCAVVLLQNNQGSKDWAEAEAHLKVAASDPRAAATSHYGLGLLALQRRQGTVAVRELRQATALDPSADVVFYQLAQAERLVGNAAGAAAALAVFQGRQEEKRTEMQMLSEVYQHPGVASGYSQLAAYLGEHGKRAQAQAVLAEARRRKLLH